MLTEVMLLALTAMLYGRYLTNSQIQNKKQKKCINEYCDYGLL